MNLGTISNVSASGTINGQNLLGVTAGGLVGMNGTLGPTPASGLIMGSNANVAVTLGSGSACPGSCLFNAAGGLAGANVAGSLIENSFAQGSVTVGSSAWGGGLVGINGSSATDTSEILNSFATGSVFSAGLNVGLGGLVGLNSPGSTITTSYATGNVTSTASVPDTAGLLGQRHLSVRRRRRAGRAEFRHDHRERDGTHGGHELRRRPSLRHRRGDRRLEWRGRRARRLQQRHHR